MPAWETYYKELLSRGHGHALWDADPGQEPAVDIADVGYVEEGAFVRLFNASKPIGDTSNTFGTPDGYKPLSVGAIRKGTLSANLPITSETVLQRKVEVNISGGSMVQSGGGFIFECNKEQGAVLILGEDADRRNALQKHSFIRYVLENHRSWLQFSNDVHERGISLDQLLLVTGCDRTSAWACAAFSASSNKLGLEFRVGKVGVAQGGVSIWGSWNNCQSVSVHSGPRIRQTQSSNSQPTGGEAADLISPNGSKENRPSSNVDSPQETAVGNVQLSDAIKAGNEALSRWREGQDHATEPKAWTSVVGRGIMLFGLFLARGLLRICGYVFAFVFGNARQPSLGHLSEAKDLVDDNTVSTPTTASKAPSPPSRNQSVFVRGFKICDKSSMRKRMRLLGRKKPPEDGFTHLIRRKRDDKDDPGRSRGQSNNISSYSLGDRESAISHGGDTGEHGSTGSSSHSPTGSQYSLGSLITASETDNLSVTETEQSDRESTLYHQCNGVKQLTHLDILMEYILENSSAELALVHHDDLTTMLEHVTSMSAFESILYQAAPTIFVENSVGMLESTFKASQDTKSTNGVTLIFTPDSKDQKLRGSNRFFGKRHGSVKSKVLESILSSSLACPLSRTGIPLAGAEQMLMPWVLRSHGDRNIYSPALYPSCALSNSAPTMIPDAVLLQENSTLNVVGDNNMRTLSQLFKIYQERWQPMDPKYAICIPTVNGKHYELSKRYVTDWVAAQCNGSLTAPETSITDVETTSGRFVPSCVNSKQGATAVSFVSPHGSTRRGLSRTGTYSNNDSITSVTVSSGLPGPGHTTGKAFRWLSKKVLNVVAHTTIMARCRCHITLLRKWERGKGKVLGVRERVMVLIILEDALEVSRQCYPAKLNRCGYAIGRQVQRWLQSFLLSPDTPETTEWLIQVHVCLMSLLLSRISALDQTIQNLAREVSTNLTRMPISLLDHSAPAIVICLVVQELAYSQFTFQHSWLGVWLARIVELSLKVRRLTEHEVKAIWMLAVRRKKDQAVLFHIKFSRPWEVALFAQIATQEAWLKPIVLDMHGLPSLVKALDGMLAHNIDSRAVHWNSVALTLRALSFSLEHEWIASIVESKIITSLLRVFRRSIPEKWFCVRFWAADAIRNVVAYQHTLVRTLLKENAIAAIRTLADPKLDLGPYQSVPVNRRINTIKSSVQNRLFENYKREGLKRAAELVVYVEQWTPELPPTAKLEAVTQGWDGYLGGIEQS